jgi:hypothetical protein
MVVALVVVVLIALGVHACQVSAQTNALKSYSNSVASLITESNSTGARLFDVLSHGGGSASAQSMQNSINQTLSSATAQLNHAKRLSVPDQARTAHRNLLLALQMRADAISNIAQKIQPALGNQDSKAAIYAIAAQMARLYASDVVYKDYTTTEIAAALHSAGIPVGGANGQQIVAGQFVPNLSWMSPQSIADKLHVTLPSAGHARISPGTHGHELNSVTVGGTTLQTGSTNTITASPPPSFTLNFLNSGTNNETNVVCKVTVSGTSDTGQTVVPETIAGHSASCNVMLQSTPATGTATVVATIEPVPGEKHIANNTLRFPVSFQ